MADADITVEPRSSPITLPPGVMSIDIKVEPSSPLTVPHLGLLVVNGKDFFEQPVLLPRIVSVTSLISSSEMLGDAAVVQNDKRISEGAAESSAMKLEMSLGDAHECDKCGCRVVNKKQHVCHVRTGEKMYSCFVCSRKFVSKRSLTTHVRRHTGEKPHACVICGRKFLCNSNLARHTRVHTREMSYACDMCPSKFTRKDVLDKHKRKHASWVHACHWPGCGRGFKWHTTLQEHLKGHEKAKPYPCHLCPARFHRKGYLEKHVATHAGQRPFKCPVCERHYARHDGMKTHMLQKHLTEPTPPQQPLITGRRL